MIAAMSENLWIAILINIPAVLGAVVAAILALRSKKSADMSAHIATMSLESAAESLKVAQDIHRVVSKHLGETK